MQKLLEPEQIIHIEKHYTIEIFNLKNPNASGSNLLTLFILHNLKFQVLFCKHPIVIYHCLPLFIIRLPQAETSPKFFFFFFYNLLKAYSTKFSQNQEISIYYLLTDFQLKSYKRHE